MDAHRVNAAASRLGQGVVVRTSRVFDDSITQFQRAGRGEKRRGGTERRTRARAPSRSTGCARRVGDWRTAFSREAAEGSQGTSEPRWKASTARGHVGSSTSSISRPQATLSAQVRALRPSRPAQLEPWAGWCARATCVGVARRRTIHLDPETLGVPPVASGLRTSSSHRARELGLDGSSYGLCSALRGVARRPPVSSPPHHHRVRSQRALCPYQRKPRGRSTVHHLGYRREGPADCNATGLLQQ